MQPVRPLRHVLPDAAINEELEVDLEYCKGCGICANECPKKAIKMEREEK
jgi:pyruvate ferredoxin oxidoreductase delta subunit